MSSSNAYTPQSAVAPLRAARQRDTGTTKEAQSQPQRKRRIWLLWVALLVVAVGAIIGIRLFPPPVAVQLTQPELRDVTETLASSGLVGGQHETSVGSQAQAVVAELFVKEGDVVIEGQLLARVQNSVALAQAHQATQALSVAKAQLAQAKQGAQPSQLQAARARIRQTEAGLSEQQAHLARTQTALQQAETAISRSVSQKERAQATVLQ